MEVNWKIAVIVVCLLIWLLNDKFEFIKIENKETFEKKGKKKNKKKLKDKKIGEKLLDRFTDYTFRK